MEKIYRKSPVAVIWNLILMLAAAALGLVVLGYFAGTEIAVGGAALLTLFILWSMFRQFRMKVAVEGGTLTIVTGGRTHSYDLDRVSLSARARNNDTFTLRVEDEHGSESFDLSLLGSAQFNRLLEDIGLIGDKSTVTRLDVTENTER